MRQFKNTLIRIILHNTNGYSTPTLYIYIYIYIYITPVYGCHHLYWWVCGRANVV